MTSDSSTVSLYILCGLPFSDKATFQFLRAFKIFGFAIFDLLVSFVGIYLLSPLLTRLFRYLHLEIPAISWLFFTLPIGVLTHLIVNTHTPMTKEFLDPSSHYLLKLVIIALTLLGISKIKLIK